MPMTPGCQPSPAAKTIGPSGALSTCAIAASSTSRFDLPPLGVEHVEMHGERARLARIVGRQQPRAEIGFADAAAGIDARTQDEAGVIGVELLADARRHRLSAAMPVLARLRITLSPCATSARLTPVSGTTSQTVPSATRSSHCRRSGAGRVSIPARLAQRAVDADDEQERHADRGEHAMHAVFVEPIGIDHGIGVRQRGSPR